MTPHIIAAPEAPAKFNAVIECNGSIGIAFKLSFLKISLVEFVAKNNITAKDELSQHTAPGHGVCFDSSLTSVVQTEIKMFQGFIKPLKAISGAFETLSRDALEYTNKTGRAWLFWAWFDDAAKDTMQTLTFNPEWLNFPIENLILGHWEGKTASEMSSGGGYYPFLRDRPFGKQAFCTTKTDLKYTGASTIKLGDSAELSFEVAWRDKKNYVSVQENERQIKSLTPDILQVNGNTITGLKEGTGKIEVQLYIHKNAKDNDMTLVPSLFYKEFTITVTDEDPPPVIVGYWSGPSRTFNVTLQEWETSIWYFRFFDDGTVITVCANIEPFSVVKGWLEKSEVGKWKNDGSVYQSLVAMGEYTFNEDTLAVRGDIQHDIYGESIIQGFLDDGETTMTLDFTIIIYGDNTSEAVLELTKLE